MIYYLQGLPSGPTAYRGFGYLARTLNRAKENAILIVPQVSRISGTDPEYLDWSSTDDWPMAISHDLTQCIDRRYNTIASRRGRALMGVSAGGFGALNIGFRHLRTFAAVESWSGSFAATDPTGTHVLNLGSAKANAAARVPYGASMRSSLSRWPSLLGFFVGQADSDLSWQRTSGLTRRSARAAYGTCSTPTRAATAIRCGPARHRRGSRWR